MSHNQTRYSNFRDPERCKGLRRRTSASMYDWDSPYPSSRLTWLWVTQNGLPDRYMDTWTFKPAQFLASTKMGYPVSGMDQNSCGLPLLFLSFCPTPAGPAGGGGGGGQKEVPSQLAEGSVGEGFGREDLGERALETSAWQPSSRESRAIKTDSGRCRLRDDPNPCLK